MENRVSNRQLEELLDFLANHSNIVRGVAPRSKPAVDRQWNVIAEKLNSHDTGCTKTALRWKRYWADLKHKAKSRLSQKKQGATRAGGGSSSGMELSEIDKKVLDIIGESAVFGDIKHKIPVIVPQSPCEPLVTQRGESESEESVTSAGESPERRSSKHPRHQRQTRSTSAESPERRPSKRRRHQRQTRRSSAESPERRPSKRRRHQRQTRRSSAESPERRPSKRRRHQRQSRRSSTDSTVNHPSAARFPRSLQQRSSRKPSEQTEFNPQWLMELEEKRVAAESKIADAAMIMAETMRGHVVAINKLTEALAQFIDKQ